MSKESKTYKNMPKKIYIRTFGCQMNDRDSEIVKGLLLAKGFNVKDTWSDRIDAVLLNTCSVRQHAEDKVWSEIGRLVKLRPKPVIGLIGCMAESYRERAFRKARGIDLVVGPNNIDAIPLLLKQALAARTKGVCEKQEFLAVGKRERDEFVYKAEYREEKDHCYVVISEGCDNFCTYCVVPYVRGMLRNRHHESVIQEIKNKINKGVRDITLLGQNVNAYHSDTKDFDFVELLERVNALKGLKRFTFVTSHPKDATERLFEAMARLNKLKKYLHLAVQSGSSRILKLMGRGYTRQHYLYLVDRYRSFVRDGELSTDIIVGFPGETDEDFRNTLDLIKRVRFNNAYIFKYSVRPHAEAGKLKDDVPKDLKEDRHRILLEAQKNISRELKLK